MLLGQIKIISKDTLIYGLGSILGGVVNFLLLPLYTHYLTPSDYGHLAIFIVVQTLVQTIATFGLSNGLIRYYLMAQDSQEKKTVISTVFWTQVLFVVLLAALLVPLSLIFSNFLFGTAAFSFLLIMSFLTAFIVAFNAIPYSLLRADRKRIFYAALLTSKIILQAAINIYLIVILKLNFKGIIYGTFLAESIIALIVVSWFFRHFKYYLSLVFSISFFSRLMKFTGPVFISNILFLFLSLSDRFFLNHFLPPAEVGIYSLGYSLGSIVLFGLIVPFTTAFLPYALSLAKKPDFKDIFPKVVKYFFILSAGLSLLLFYFSKEVVILISNPAYYRSSNIVGLIIVSVIFNGLYCSTSIPLQIVEKTRLATIGVFLGAVVSVCLNLLLIPRLGIYGAGLSSCISFGVFFAVAFSFAQKHYPIQYEYIAFWKFCCIALVYVMIYFTLNILVISFWLNVAIKLCIIISFPFLLYLFRVLDFKERRYLKNFFRSI